LPYRLIVTIPQSVSCKSFLLRPKMTKSDNGSVSKSFLCRHLSP
jgi:hypothetical protein